MKKHFIVPLALVFFLWACKADQPADVKSPEQAKALDVQAEKIDTAYYLHLGDSLSRETFDTLSAALKAQVESKGASGALEYCNVQAYPITALLAKDGIKIRRSSLQFRNPANAPSSLEEEVLEWYVTEKNYGRPLNTTLRSDKGEIHFFKPILVQDMCLKCHGVAEKDIDIKTMETLQKLYPEDMAKNYAAGDLRGAWHISFPEQP